MTDTDLAPIGAVVKWRSKTHQSGWRTGKVVDHWRPDDDQPVAAYYISPHNRRNTGGAGYPLLVDRGLVIEVNGG
jgi:hypothetical protein